MAVSKQPSITPETSSGEGLDEEQSSRGEAKWKRFHPFRVVRKIFRRRVKRQGTGEEPETSKKSWSTSELQSVQDIPNKYEAPSPPYKLGLSVSHDSIFSPESSNLVGTEELNRPQGSSLSMQHAGIKNMFKDELFSRVRARRDSDDDDIGLPHSPCTSPTTVDVLTQGLKSKSLKSQTTCSAGSLISMGSSENDEDSAVASSSGNSSRMSLLDRRSLDFEGDPDLSQPVPLNHQAARHRIAVRPKRTHGLPQKRLKQLAAAKMNTLPATPEVTEYLKAESTSTIITSTASMHQISKMVTTTSRENVISQSTSEKALTESKSTTEHSQLTLTTEHSQSDRHEFHVKSVSSSSIHAMQMEKKNSENDAVVSENSSFEQNNTERNLQYLASSDTYENSNAESNHLIMEKTESSIETTELPKHSSEARNASIENYLQSVLEKESYFDSVSKNDTTEDLHQKNENLSQEPQLRVSALVKSIEQSDSVIKHEETVLTEEEMHENLDINKDLSLMSDLKSCSIMHTLKESDSVQENNEINAYSSDNMCSLNKPIDLGSRMSNICFDEFKGKSLVSDKISNMSTNVQSNNAISFEKSQMEKEIRQQFQQQKNVTKHAKDPTSPSSVSRFYSEEESIMSDKFVSPSAVEKVPTQENSKISISHHISEDSIQHETITEARNLVTVDETFNLNVQGFSRLNSSSTVQQNVHQNESWISSFDVPSSISQNSDVTINTVTSNIYSQKLTEDRVTISINSSNVKTSHSEVQSNELISESVTPPVLKDNKISNKPVASKPAPLVRSTPDEKAKKPEIKKSPSPDSHSRTPFPKNVNIPKKVSVEIVPFSQRMKEKKYQPLSFSGKNINQETGKATANVVERNLSERRISSKSKETEKTNNRHSFSGALPAEIERQVMNSAIDKTGKTDKLHYPVQIRIHKSKVDEKENTGDEPQTNKDGKALSDIKLNSELIKQPKESKHSNELPTKWEVKVQSAMQTKEALLTQTEIKKALSESKSIINKSIEPEENQDVSQLSTSPSNLQEQGVSAMDNTSLKNKDSIRKPGKEATSPKDPEPELLRVFARRSIKQKHGDKEKHEDKISVTNESTSPEGPSSLSSLENCKDLDTLVSSPVTNASVVEPTKSISPDIVRKKSKSFSEKEKPATHFLTPLKDTSINRRPSLKALSPDIPSIEPDNFHRRQRTASEPEVPVTLPPLTDNISCLKNQQNLTLEKNVSLTCRSDHLQRTASMSVSPSSTLSNGTSSSIRPDFDKGKENPDPSAPSWLQLAQQRRELREQRERLLLGSSTNSFLDASSKPSRSSKVWDMVNNFQKLQMT